MGLTAQSVRKKSMTDIFKIDNCDNKYVIALAGNPNTGKSTVFNYLTGLKQHTGNWPGKTVTNARGEYSHNGNDYILVDLPGTYSLFTSSRDEEVARDFICCGNYDAVLVIADATCLERNLNLVFQISEITDNIILCINLIDEAKKKDISIDKNGLENRLNIPIALTSARNGIGMNELKNKIEDVVLNKKILKPKLVRYDEEIEKNVEFIIPYLEKMNISNTRWNALRLLDSDESIFYRTSENMLTDSQALALKKKLEINVDREIIRERISAANYNYAYSLKHKFVTENIKKISRDKKIDDVVTSKVFGIPIMLSLLGIIFWITMQGANIPSKILGDILFNFQDKLTSIAGRVGMSSFLKGMLIDGLYKTLAWVVSVMLPPMAIFFPLFTLLEDLGYLPRIAFNLDHMFKKACAHGKQCLCMTMGFGCNAAGVIGCRIIESPRERLIAIITNSFVPCNGRFPTLLTISSAFFAASYNSFFNGIISAFFITLLVIIGISVTLIVSYILSKTLLKGIPSTFTLELPPYRAPQAGRILYTSIIDRTAFVLSRAVCVAAPAGAVTWLLANIYLGDFSILIHVSNFLDPLARTIGLDGFILMAFIAGLPANEIVLPILLMAYLSTGTLAEFKSIEYLREVLLNNGWTNLTALNVMLFSLLHWPCSTTLWTIKKETGSLKWTVASFLIPTAIAFLVCFFTATVYRLIF